MEPEKTPRERAEDLINLLVSDWRPSPRQVVWAIRIVLATAVMLGLLTLVGWPFGITLWDWLKLLVVPAALAIAGLLFTSSQQRAAQADAERRAQDQAVQDYLDRIGQLLIDKDLRNERETTDLRQLARGHTLSVLERLDGRHKGSVLRFLYGAGLIYAGAGQSRVIALDGADLRGADLRGMGFCSRVVHSADLLGDTELRRRAEQLGVSIFEVSQPTGTVDLMKVKLGGADLRGADLGGANLASADLSGADLRGANLSHAQLFGVRGISAEQLREQCKVLDGATLPNQVGRE